MVLIDLLSSFSGILRVKSSLVIDNAVFKLHYVITAAMLFAFCVLVTARSLVGDPINCVHDDNPRLQDEVVNTYCWIHTTFTLPKYHNKPYGSYTGIVHPGVGLDTNEDEKVYHSYYQWVPFALFLQGILFYAPYWLWKAWEGGRMGAMVDGLTNPVQPATERNEKIFVLADYLVNSLRRHKSYAYKFFFCEFLNFMNVILNMWFLDSFFGGMFFRFGSDVVSFMNDEQEHRTDPLIILFPRVTKCTFHLFGPSGTMERHDLMCVLALNIINEKIFIFLWFWFIILAVISSLGLIYRCIIICSPNVRIGLLRKKSRIRYKQAIVLLVNELEVEDYFIVHCISKNIELLPFNLLIEEMYRMLSAKNRGVQLNQVDGNQNEETQNLTTEC